MHNLAQILYCLEIKVEVMSQSVLFVQREALCSFSLLGIPCPSLSSERFKGAGTLIFGQRAGSNMVSVFMMDIIDQVSIFMIYLHTRTSEIPTPPTASRL